MTQRINKPLLGMLALGAAAVPMHAHAAVGFASLPQSIAQISIDQRTGCDARLAPSMGSAATTTQIVPAYNKSSAILGGRPSRLELMARQQSGEAGLAPAAGPMAPGVAGVRSLASTVGCQNFTAATTRPVLSAPGYLARTLNDEDFLASKRLTISHTSFDSSWDRVSKQSLSGRSTRDLRGLTGKSGGEATLMAVNTWANTRIRYVEDQKLYGKADYWAPASTTLRRGAGDCEDIAILKMQLLAASGIPRSDMYLTIARDLIRNADHALLIVKLDGKHWMLDNATNQLLDARESHSYRPILSFGADRKWLHGYSSDQRSVIASSSALSTGFRR